MNLKKDRATNGGDERKDVRWQLVVSEDRDRELRRLMEECDISTQKELVNAALTMFQWAVKERRSGRSIASIDEETMKYKELSMPVLDSVRRQIAASTSR